jgi:hypothetical protein
MNWKSPVIVLVSLGVFGLLIAGTVVVGGWYNVGATSPHSPIVEKMLRYTMERSVSKHASEVNIPQGINLEDPILAEKAIGHYSIACAPCHAAPGEPRASWMVLYPPPPNLTDEQVIEAWSDEELFWIIKNGIKDTGMIALPPGHSDDDVWAIAAFVRQLPNLTPKRYRALVEAYLAVSAHAEHGSSPRNDTGHDEKHGHVN